MRLKLMLGGLAMLGWALPPDVRAQDTNKPIQVTTRETALPQLGRVPADVRDLRVNDAHTLALYSVRRGNEWIVGINGKESGGYELAGFGPESFSADGKRFAYVATRKGRELLVVDGEEIAEHRSILFDGFSTDSKRMAYVARRQSDGKWLVVADGKEGKAYEDLYDPTILSTDGRHATYLAGQAGKFILVVEGKETQVYDNFLPDPPYPPYGQPDVPVVFVTKRDGKYFVVTLGQEGKPYDQSKAYDLISFPVLIKKGRVAYIARHDDRTYMVVNGQERVMADTEKRKLYIDLTISADGQHVAYFSGRDDKVFVVVDGQEGKGYSEVFTLAMSADGKHVAYVAQKYFRESGVFVVVDGKEGPTYQGIYDLVLSPDGRRVAYRATKAVVRRGGIWSPVRDTAAVKWFAVVDGKEGPAYDKISNFTFSADGKRLVYAARRNNKEFVVVDGQEGAPYDSVFAYDVTPWDLIVDAKQVAYWAKRGSKWVFVVNGVEKLSYEKVFNLKRRDAHSFDAFIVRDGIIHFLEVQLK